MSHDKTTTGGDGCDNFYVHFQADKGNDQFPSYSPVITEKFKKFDQTMRKHSHEQAKRSRATTGFLVTGWLATSACTGYLIYEIVNNPGNHDLQIGLFAGSIILLMASVLYLLHRNDLMKYYKAVSAGMFATISVGSALFGFIGPNAFQIDPSDFHEVQYATTLTSVICAAVAIYFVLAEIKRAEILGKVSTRRLILQTVLLTGVAIAVAWTFLSNYCIEGEILLIWLAMAFILSLTNAKSYGGSINYGMIGGVAFAAIASSTLWYGSSIDSADFSFDSLHNFQGATVVLGGLFVLTLLWSLFGFKSIKSATEPVFVIGALSVVAMTTILCFNVGFVEGVFTSGSPWIWVFFGCGCALLGTILYGIRKRVRAVIGAKAI